MSKPTKSRLRQWRESKNLSQLEAAALLGVGSVGHMSAIEHGDRTPTLRAAVRIERIVGIPCSEWIDDEPAA